MLVPCSGRRPNRRGYKITCHSNIQAICNPIQRWSTQPSQLACWASLQDNMLAECITKTQHLSGKDMLILFQKHACMFEVGTHFVVWKRTLQDDCISHYRPGNAPHSLPWWGGYRSHHCSVYQKTSTANESSQYSVIITFPGYTPVTPEARCHCGACTA